MYTTPCIQRRYWYDDKREIIDIKFMYLETGVVENKRDREREREREIEREMVKSVGGSILKKG